ncbi:MAG: metallophosphoesterase family protein [Dehalococcoidia bacterium]|nr:YfcE family phosphodiesterase [Dehalococcoidia bacterium]MDO8636654.1 metallophosphoesterase family protein [Dehalococcoidia bacterium]
MLVGLISDTHIPQAAKYMPPQVKEAFKNVDLILHAGDIYQLSVLDELEQIAPVLAARGNGDTKLPPDPRIKESQVLTLDGMSLGMTHSVEYPEPPWCTIEKAMEREFGGPVEIIVSGDTHVAIVESYKGILIINPGSPTLPNGMYQLGTVGLLEISAGRVEARIIQLR